MGAAQRTNRGLRRSVSAVVATAAAVWALASPLPATAQSELPLTTELVVTAPEGIEVPSSGGTGVLRATVTSEGAVAAPDTEVTITLPPGVTHEPGLPGADPDCTAIGAEVTCPLGTLPPGDSGTVAIGVRTGPLPPGAHEAIAASPISARWDRAAGELGHRSWDAEAGGEGSSLQACWPVANLTPNMDLTGGGPGGGDPCDGTDDRPPLRPDVDGVQEAFPPAFSDAVTRSWEWRTRITPAWTGAYRICAAGIDDGAYVAVSPAGVDPTAGDVVLDLPASTPTAEGRVDLEAGQGYDVLIRVSNRGPDGVDDGGAGPGGWGYVGVEPFIADCSPASAAALSVGAPGFTPAVSIPITVVGVARVRLTGTVTSGDRRFSVARAVNDGPDPTFVVPTVTGGLDPLPVVPLQPGEAAVWSSALDPAAVRLGTVPWSLDTLGTIPP